MVVRDFASGCCDPNLCGGCLAEPPLAAACRRGHCRVVAVLLADTRVVVDAVNKFGGTALMAAASVGELGALTLVLMHACTDVNLQSRNRF